MTPRTWRVSHFHKLDFGRGVRVTFTINKNIEGFISTNQKDFDQYVEIMMDEVEFRKTLPEDKLKVYESFLEDDNG